MGETAPMWLPLDFAHPEFIGLPTGHHLRPIRADDVDIDYPAVMGSQARLWTIFGEPWGFPPETMTVEQDRGELETYLADFVAKWLASAWPFAMPRFIGRDLSWQEWLALPEISDSP